MFPALGPCSSQEGQKHVRQPILGLDATIGGRKILRPYNHGNELTSMIFGSIIGLTSTAGRPEVGH